MLARPVMHVMFKWQAVLTAGNHDSRPIPRSGRTLASTGFGCHITLQSMPDADVNCPHTSAKDWIHQGPWKPLGWRHKTGLEMSCLWRPHPTGRRDRCSDL